MYLEFVIIMFPLTGLELEMWSLFPQITFLLMLYY